MNSCILMNKLNNKMMNQARLKGEMERHVEKKALRMSQIVKWATSQAIESNQLSSN